MIDYRQNVPLEAADIARVFASSGIVRPTNDLPRLARMFATSNLVVSAWSGDTLVGVGRALTDFSYCCYLSDLAVAREFQRQGIGAEIIRRVRAALGEEVMLLLLSAPGAMSYYPNAGFARADNAFLIKRAR